MEICNAGECIFGCPDDYDACDDTCVNLSSNSSHCGTCGNACTGTGQCVNGECYSPVTSVAIEPASLQMEVGGGGTLVAVVLPADASNKSVVWSSSLPEIVSVDQEGNVAGHVVGSAMITATSVQGGVIGSAQVSVVIPVTGVTIYPETATLQPGGSMTLQALVLPANASDKMVSWATSDSSIVTVDSNGLIRSVGPEGAAEITATTVDGNYSATASVDVTVVPVTGVTINPAELEMVPGEKFTLQAVVSPENATNKKVIWISANTSVATINGTTGQVTAVAGGQADISAVTVSGGLFSICKVTVTVPVTGLNVAHSAMTLNRGESVQIMAEVVPANATVTGLIWSSSDVSVATVDQSGFVTAMGEGAATIYVLTVDGGFTRNVNLTVRVAVEGISVDPVELLVWPDASSQLHVVISPADATNQRLVLNSSNTNVAVVDENGLITGVAPGMAVVTIVTEDGRFTATCVVTVAVPVSDVTLNKTTISLSSGSGETLVATVLPPNASNKAVIWSSSDESKVVVDQAGNVTAIGMGGEATVTVTTVDKGYTATCLVKLDLYYFSSHQFTTCGQSGRTGPSQSQCTSTYSSSSWAQNSELFTVSGGIQYWTAPKSGTFQIEAAGARGGGSRYDDYGYGAYMKANFELTAGQRIKILVGQMGNYYEYGGGGGGGTFVATENNEPLLVAGGGAGDGHCSARFEQRHGTTGSSGMVGSHGSSSATGGAAGGNSGNGGNRYDSYNGSGGGGMYGDGANSYSSTDGGRAFVNGGAGGTSRGGASNGWGGFGGGGGGATTSCSSSYRAGGGGGGYSGGGSGYYGGHGGGGGSFSAGSSTTSTVGNNNNHGYVKITAL